MKLIAYIVPTFTHFLMSVGTHNGYVAVPPEHPCHGQDYESVQVDVHGGLTFGTSASVAKTYWRDIEFLGGDSELPDDYWVFGFDTCHFGDSPIDWDRERVIAETLNLKEQLENLSIN